MRFSEWLNENLEILKDKEKKTLANMKLVMDPMGRVLGINKKGYDDLKAQLDDIRKKISNQEKANWIKKAV
jgi:hypothetical protein